MWHVGHPCPLPGDPPGCPGNAEWPGSERPLPGAVPARAQCPAFPGLLSCALPALPSLWTTSLRPPSPQVAPQPRPPPSSAGEYEKKGLIIIDEEEFLLIDGRT